MIVKWGFFFSQNTLKPGSRELITNALMQVLSAVAILEQGRRSMSHVENFEQNFVCLGSVSKHGVVYLPTLEHIDLIRSDVS